MLKFLKTNTAYTEVVDEDDNLIYEIDASNNAVSEVFGIDKTFNAGFTIRLQSELSSGEFVATLQVSDTSYNFTDLRDASNNLVQFTCTTVNDDFFLTVKNEGELLFANYRFNIVSSSAVGTYTISLNRG